MNQHESSGSEAGSDDEDMTNEGKAMDAIGKAILEAEAEDLGAMEVDPEVQRQNDIMAEVARRRAERDANSTKRKSDEIFDRFDVDRDGYLNFRELCELGRATGGDLPHAAYVSVCQEIGADPSKGVDKALLLIMYSDASLGDAHRDHNLIFKT